MDEDDPRKEMCHNGCPCGLVGFHDEPKTESEQCCVAHLSFYVHTGGERDTFTVFL